MSFTGFIDIAIGLILMYLMLSLMCTTVNELIATFFKLRASSLSKKITQIIDDEAVRKAFYNHGIIINAHSASQGEDGKPLSKQQTGHPSYLHNCNFAMALLDSLDQRAQEDPQSQKAFPSIADIQKSVEDMKDCAIRDVLLANLATASGDLTKLRDNVADWFDTAMDRLSGDYKRRIKGIALIVGFLIAVLVNADSLNVGTALWNDETLRGEVVSAASDVLKTGEAMGKSACKVIQVPAEKVHCLAEELRPFPLGWRIPNIDWAHINWAHIIDWIPIDWAHFGWFGLKFLGFLWTGLAISLGAPFWFDLLQKFMNLRGE